MFPRVCLPGFCKKSFKWDSGACWPFMTIFKLLLDAVVFVTHGRNQNSPAQQHAGHLHLWTPCPSRTYHTEQLEGTAYIYLKGRCSLGQTTSQSQWGLGLAVLSWDTSMLQVLGPAMLLTAGSKAPEAPPPKPCFFSRSKKTCFLYSDAKYLGWGVGLQKYKKEKDRKIPSSHI